MTASEPTAAISPLAADTHAVFNLSLDRPAYRRARRASCTFLFANPG